VMDNAYSVAFGTVPSHSSLMTALPAALHGVYENSMVLGAGHTTLAERLRHAGYATAAFVSSKPLARSVGLDQGFDVYDDEFVFDATSGLAWYSMAERRAEATIGRFLEWMGVRPQGPFFAWIHLNDAHQPYWPPDSGDEGEPQYVHVEGALREQMESDANFRDAVEAEARDRYRREIEHLDSELGRAIDYLREQGLYDSTVIVFVADHGENFGEHGLELAFDHPALFGSVSHLPLILKLPASQHRGTRSQALVGNLDIAPTLVDELGMARPSAWSGHSFREVLEGTLVNFRNYLVLEGAGREEIAVRTPTSFYREVTEEFRNDEVLGYLGYAPGKPAEFYALDSDPDELSDLYPVAEAEPFEAIAARFLAIRNPPTVSRTDSPEHRQALKALGYL
jgi:arylsulfatase A-like enzyme